MDLGYRDTLAKGGSGKFNGINFTYIKYDSNRFTVWINTFLSKLNLSI